ncbi:hypothetical protein [Aestuariivirga sp.]|uniref:hypothetical protein n=1 Tax=Aestuariivirga sp. TaxID=2650926 RepID=UPI0039E63D2B
MAEEQDPLIDLTEGRELVINRIVSGGFYGSQHVILLGTNRYGAGPDGKLQGQCAIVARLRFDNDMAKILRDALNHGLAVLSPPANEKAN